MISFRLIITYHYAPGKTVAENKIILSLMYRYVRQTECVERGLAMAYGYVTRSEFFSAAHRLHSHQLSAEENQRVYGKCNNEHGHGHNYRVSVTVSGEIDPATGMVVDLSLLKQLMWSDEVLAGLDHRHLDKEVEFFQKRPSTAENIAVYVWEKMVGPIQALKAQLVSVRIDETEHNSAEYRGE